MEIQNKKRWYWGYEILDRGVETFELLNAVNAGKLVPYQPETGKRCIEIEKLKTLMTKKELDQEITIRKRPYEAEPGFTMTEMLHPKYAIYVGGFQYQDVVELMYKANEVNAFLKEFIPGYKEVVSTESIKDEGTPDLEEYIKQRCSQGESKEIIAARLNDPKGPFKLSYSKSARALGLDRGLNAGQFDAIKQRGRRACKKGREMLKKMDMLSRRKSKRDSVTKT